MIKIFDGIFNRRVRNVSLIKLENKDGDGYLFKANYFDCGNLYNACSYFVADKDNHSYIKINNDKYDYNSMRENFDKIQVILEKENIKMALAKLS